jgi:hypothetical protein
MARNLQSTRLAFYDEAMLHALVARKPTVLLAEQLRHDADLALDSEAYAPDSERFDSTRLQRLFRDTTSLALASCVRSEDRYAEHAAGLVRKWFVDSDTKMNPHVHFAQGKAGHGGCEVNDLGVIEFEDFYYFLDAVRLIVRSGALPRTDVAAFRSWLRSRLAWLETSPQGIRQSCEASSHGTMYDLQVAAIAAFLGKTAPLSSSFRRARERMQLQFDRSGAQPQRMRTMTRHHCCFNLQGWVSLARLAEFCGDDLWSYATSDGRSICMALEWLITTHDGGSWPSSDVATFDEERLTPLRRDLDHHHRGRKIVDPVERFSGRAIHHPTSGIAPYWMLARP